VGDVVGMKKLVTILVILVLSLNGIAQDIATVRSLLKGKEITALTDYLYARNDSGNFRSVDVRWKVRREILPGHEEEAFVINVFRNDGSSRWDNYSLELLSAGKYIFYYKFTATKFTDTTGDDWKSYDVLLDSFTDVAAYERFEKSFIKAFGVSINKAEMFVDDIVYGDLCGYGGGAPHYRYLLDSLLQKRDSKTILSWLRSPNTEKQLYGLQGAAILDRLGYKVSADDERIIKIIRQKKGFVYTCGGCFFSSDSIHKVIARIDFLKGRHPGVQNGAVVSMGIIYGVAALILLFAAIIYYNKRRVLKNKITSV
jgi:hypothetical protein